MRHGRLNVKSLSQTPREVPHTGTRVVAEHNGDYDNDDPLNGGYVDSCVFRCIWLPVEEQQDAHTSVCKENLNCY